MAISLNGTSQYVTLANGSNPTSARPFTFACTFDSINLRGTGSYECLYSQGLIWYAGTGGGWTYLIEAATNPRFEFGMENGASRSVHSTLTITRNNGWYFFAGVVRDGGSNTVVDFFSYSYRSSALTVNAGLGVSPTSDNDPAAPGGTQPVIIGAGRTDAPGFEDHMTDAMGWVAVWTGDLGNTGSSTAPAIWELIVRGAWGLLDSNCKLFIPFAGAAQDLSGAGLHGTLNGSPSYVGSGPAGELSALDGARVVRKFASGTVFTQGVDVTASTTFSLIKSAGKIVAVTNTPTMTKIAVVNKSIPTITAADIVTVTKQANKSVSVSSSVSAAVATASTFVKEVAVSVGNAVSVVKLAAKNIAISVASAVTNTSVVNKTLSFTSETTVSIVKQAVKLITITASNAATLTKHVQIGLSFTADVSVSVIKSVWKTISATASNIVSIATQFIEGGGELFTQTINVTVSTSMSLARQTQKIISTAVTTGASISRAVSKITSIIATTTITIPKSISKSIVFTVSSTVSVAKGLFQSISITVSNSVSIDATQLLGIVTTFYKSTASIALRVKDAASSALNTIHTKILNIKGSDDAEL